jgi:hypothetical protein
VVQLPPTTEKKFRSEGAVAGTTPSKYATVDYSSQVFPSHRTWFSIHFPVVDDVYQSVFGILKIAQQTEFSRAQTVNECEEIDSKASEQTLKLLLKWICVPGVRHEKLTTKLGKKERQIQKNILVAARNSRATIIKNMKKMEQEL